MVNYFFYILLGFFIGFMNDLGVKITVNIFVKNKKLWVVNLSFLLRMFIICTIFYIMSKFIPISIFFLAIGLIINRISLKIKIKG